MNFIPLQSAVHLYGRIGKPHKEGGFRYKVEVCDTMK